MSLSRSFAATAAIALLTLSLSSCSGSNDKEAAIEGLATMMETSMNVEDGTFDEYATCVINDQYDNLSPVGQKFLANFDPETDNGDGLPDEDWTVIYAGQENCPEETEAAYNSGFGQLIESEEEAEGASEEAK